MKVRNNNKYIPYTYEEVKQALHRAIKVRDGEEVRDLYDEYRYRKQFRDSKFFKGYLYSHSKDILNKQNIPHPDLFDPLTQPPGKV